MEALILTLHRADISTVIDKVWDAVVIGAGPAGTMAACSIGDRGLSVLLIDRQTFPRKKVCGGCLSAAAIELLAQSGLLSSPIEQMERCDRKIYGRRFGSTMNTIQLAE